jgi:hypothetical protein
MSAREGLRGHSEYGRVFWALGGIGWGLMAFGTWGILARARATEPPELAAWVVGAAVVHDLVVAPVVFSVGRAVGRATRGLPRAAIQAALVLTGILVLYSIPVVGGLGRLEDNPSLLPREYGTSLVVLLAAVWGLTGAALVWARPRWGRTNPGRPPGTA